MSRDALRDSFTGVAFKRLSAVEAHPERSNQHEFNGTRPLRDLLGADRETLPARFLYLDDESDEPLTAQGSLTWYDARERHPTRTEYRLFYPDNPVSAMAVEGDLLLIARRPDGSLLVIIARAGSTAARQVLLLFGIAAPQLRLQLKEL